MASGCLGLVYLAREPGRVTARADRGAAPRARRRGCADIRASASCWCARRARRSRARAERHALPGRRPGRGRGPAGAVRPERRRPPAPRRTRSPTAPTSRSTRPTGPTPARSPRSRSSSARTAAWAARSPIRSCCTPVRLAAPAEPVVGAEQLHLLLRELARVARPRGVPRAVRAGRTRAARAAAGATGMDACPRAGCGRTPAADRVGLVVGVFVFVLPRVANYGDVLDVVARLSTLRLVAALGPAILNLLTFAPPWMAALPGLSFVHSLVMSQASDRRVERAARRRCRRAWRSPTRCFASWGFGVVPGRRGGRARPRSSTCSPTSSSPSSRRVLLAVGGESNPLLTTAAVSARRARATSSLFAVRPARRGLRAPRRRPRRARWRTAGSADPSPGPVSRLGRASRDLPARGVGLLRRRWFLLTLATLAGPPDRVPGPVVSLRAVGVPASRRQRRRDRSPPGR